MSNNTCFIHLRRRGNNGQVSERGGLTIAYRDDGQGNTEVGFTIVSDKDAYCRSIGRDYASENMKKETSPYSFSFPTFDFHKEAARRILNPGHQLVPVLNIRPEELEERIVDLAASLKAAFVQPSGYLITNVVQAAVFKQIESFEHANFLPKNS